MPFPPPLDEGMIEEIITEYLNFSSASTTVRMMCNMYSLGEIMIQYWLSSTVKIICVHTSPKEIMIDYKKTSAVNMICNLCSIANYNTIILNAVFLFGVFFFNKDFKKLFYNMSYAIVDVFNSSCAGCWNTDVSSL